MSDQNGVREAIMHDLKCDRGPFQDILSGNKRAEVRRDDRDFRVGDRINLLETVNTAEEMRAGAPLEYTGGQDLRAITHVQRGYGLPDGVVVLSFGDALESAFPADQVGDKRDPRTTFNSPLTPYGMLVRALRIVVDTTMYEMAKSIGRSPAYLSAIEHGRTPAADDVVADTARFFAQCGIDGVLWAMTIAQRASKEGA